MKRLITIAVAALSLSVSQAWAQTVTNIAPRAKVAGVSLGDIVYQALKIGESNILKRVDVLGGYGIMWNRLGRKDTEAVSRGPTTGLDGEVFSHRTANQWVWNGGVGWGVMAETAVTRQIVDAGIGGRIPIGANAQGVLNTVGDFKDELPGVSLAPVNPRIINWRLSFITRPDAFTPGVQGEVSIPIGK